MQVKTGTQSTRKTKLDGPIYLWRTAYKVIDNHSNDLWYAYVWINDWPKLDKFPELYFVPSEVVVNTLKQCQSDGEVQEFFWMKAADAVQYKGECLVQPASAF